MQRYHQSFERALVLPENPDVDFNEHHRWTADDHNPSFGDEGPMRRESQNRGPHHVIR